MFITIKLSRKVLLAAALGALALVGVLAWTFFAPRLSEPVLAEDSQVQTCIEVLTGFGWQVEPMPLETETVLLPEELSDGYLALQSQAGFDLTDHIGQTVTRYTFRVQNYPTGETDVLADVLVRDGQVIGGDIRTAALNGFIHSLIFPA